MRSRMRRMRSSKGIVFVCDPSNSRAIFVQVLERPINNVVSSGVLAVRAKSEQRNAFLRYSFGLPDITASLSVTGGSATGLSGTDAWAKPLSVMKKSLRLITVATRVAKMDH